MRARFPLSTKVFILAFVNLLLLAGVVAAFARYQYHVALGSFLFAPARGRVLDVAQRVAIELELLPEGARTDVMARYASSYGVDFFLFANDGIQLAGRPVTLPAEVLRILRGPLDDRQAPPPREAPPPPENDGPGPPPRRADPQMQTFQTSSGGLYWVGARIPIPQASELNPLRGTLLMAAPSFYGTPLFFDFKPWLAALGAVVAIFVLCWLPFIRSLTKTISHVTRATEQIAEGRFDQQLPEDRGDELGQLSVAINRMAARLSGFVSGQKRFLGDIAHELCAPIARIQFGIGILEQRAPESQRGAVEDVQEEMRQMSSLVAELLSFSKAGMDSKDKPLAAVDVGEAARQAVAREAPEGASVEVLIHEPMLAMADANYLLRSLSNLVRNAVRYAGDAGPITISTRRENTDIVILVADSGPGLPEDELAQVFTPFYRLEASRNRSMGGAGLGLAIVKSCVEACRGRVSCRNRLPSGLEVEIRLEAA
jgi:two-component system sensor histidine kinase CpxA